MKKEHLAGLSLKGGRNGPLYLCLMEYFPDQNRTFVSSFKELKETRENNKEEALIELIEKLGIKKLVIDCPITRPFCFDCQLDCPGEVNCPVKEVQFCRQRVEDFLAQDQLKVVSERKQYELKRIASDLGEEPSELIGRSLRRRFKKGFSPYWHRPIDLWVWENYYNEMLKFFNYTYDSFGQVSLMSWSYFNYLKKVLPPDLKLYEGHPFIALIELLRAGVIVPRDLKNFSQSDAPHESRELILNAIEHKLNFFVYENDVETLLKRPRAFESFLLTLIGRCHYQNRTRFLPEWSDGATTNFVVPEFV